MMKKGDIVLIRFPFTDLSGSKLRPALVLLESNDDVIVAFITSILSERTIGDMPISRSGENGLKKDSILRLTKIATLNRDLVAGILGNLSNQELERVNSILRKIFSF